MTLHQLVIAARERLVDAGLGPDSASADAEVLARLALGWDRAQYLSCRSDPPPAGFQARFERLMARRARREPVSQIAGHREFWTRDFEVSRDVLTPRPETELLVEEALHWCAAHEPASTDPLTIVDVGTGSGCIAVTLALELPRARVIATDIAPAALAVARRNAARHSAADRVRFVRADLLAGIAAGVNLVVSNPPYVPESQRRALSVEVRDYEPPEALFGGSDGMALIERLLNQAAGNLQRGGRLLMEFGAGQDDSVEALMRGRAALRLETIRGDLQGIPRVLVATRT